MVITVWTVFVALLVVGHIFPEGFLALLTDEGHLVRLLQSVILGLCMAFRAVKPLFAAWGTN